MPDTTVQYHADGYAAARPAINVKVHCAGDAFWPDVFRSDPPIAPDGLIGDYEPFVEEANERVTSDFWQAATEIAEQRGLGEITQEGRSGGWLVFTDGRDPANPGTLSEADTLHGAIYGRQDWLDNYRSMVEWADAFIADAPRKVRDLAQQLAMDEAGEPAALRMFAFGRTA